MKEEVCSLHIFPFAMIRGAMYRNALTSSVSGGLSVLYAIRSIGINLYGNILMFVPIGFLFPFTHQKRHTAWDIFFPALFSFCIEFIQYLTGRSADIDDIILNWIGGLLGYGIFRLLYFCHNKSQNRKKRGHFLCPDDYRVYLGGCGENTINRNRSGTIRLYLT